MIQHKLHSYFSILVIAFISCLLLTGCENLLVKELDIEEDFNFTQQLGLSGTLSNNYTELGFPDPTIILLAENQSIIELVEDPIYYDTEALDLYKDGAYYNSFVNENDGRHVNLLVGNNPPFFTFEPANYRIEVDHPEFGLVSSETQMPEPVYVQSIEVDSFNFGGSSYYDEIRFVVTVQFDDPSGDNYYKVDLVNDSVYSAYSYIESLNVQGAQESYAGGYLFDDSIFDDSSFTFTFNMVVGDNGEIDLDYINEAFSLKWSCLSKDQYNFESSYTNYENSQGFGPFSEPVSIYTNVDNGLGYFGAENYYLKPFSD